EIQHLTFGGIPVSVSLLDHGDLLAVCDDGNMLLVERKTPDDFLGSLADGRLFVQMAGMKEQTQWAYLVITGELTRSPNNKVITERGETGWSWQAAQGALLTAQEMGVMVTYAANELDYEACILRLGKRERNAEITLMPQRQSRVLSIQEAIIAGLPGIGIERLSAVMDYVDNSPIWALIALTDMSSNVPGIGRAVKQRIRNALGLADSVQVILTTDDEGKEILETVRMNNVKETANENI
ncbi:MAG: hypothetical protein LLG42_11915, partial [Chloroflexi bacterium]|nr:hypothetical protein [Chloroflexota bacterium]